MDLMELIGEQDVDLGFNHWQHASNDTIKNPKETANSKNVANFFIDGETGEQIFKPAPPQLQETHLSDIEDYLDSLQNTEMDSTQKENNRMFTAVEGYCNITGVNDYHQQSKTENARHGSYLEHRQAVYQEHTTREMPQFFTPNDCNNMLLDGTFFNNDTKQQLYKTPLLSQNCDHSMNIDALDQSKRDIAFNTNQIKMDMVQQVSQASNNEPGFNLFGGGQVFQRYNNEQLSQGFRNKQLGEGLFGSDTQPCECLFSVEQQQPGQNCLLHRQNIYHNVMVDPQDQSTGEAVFDTNQVKMDMEAVQCSSQESIGQRSTVNFYGHTHVLQNFGNGRIVPDITNEPLGQGLFGCNSQSCECIFNANIEHQQPGQGFFTQDHDGDNSLMLEVNLQPPFSTDDNLNSKSLANLPHNNNIFGAINLDTVERSKVLMPPSSNESDSGLSIDHSPGSAFLDEAVVRKVELIEHTEAYDNSMGKKLKQKKQKSNMALLPRESRDERKARELQIPFTLDEIILTPVDEYNEMLLQTPLTQAQHLLVKDIRRRGKNKIAAQNCRKRKVETITNMEGDVDMLRHRKEELLIEQEELKKQMIELKKCYTLLQQDVMHDLKVQNRDQNHAPYHVGQPLPDGTTLLLVHSARAGSSTEVGCRSENTMEIQQELDFSKVKIENL